MKETHEKDLMVERYENKILHQKIEIMELRAKKHK